ncbi:hypothetical protein DM860_006937 [Cuscuta australis]|uniref:Uncharacterized protein n=1 Tax=Cuscuta australis TaxID=267555 RepID=A0A328E5I0_9ASTE|nr:hypothetical protein DM860_006937 [Cuscuta australis]
MPSQTRIPRQTCDATSHPKKRLGKCNRRDRCGRRCTTPSPSSASISSTAARETSGSRRIRVSDLDPARSRRTGARYRCSGSGRLGPGSRRPSSIEAESNGETFLGHLSVPEEVSLIEDKPIEDKVP